VPSWQSYSFAWGPVVAILALGALVLVLRWAFSSGSSLVRPPADDTPGEPTDYGLLVAVAAPRSYESARLVTDALDRAGITTTLARTTQGLRVLVFPEDADRARAVVAGLSP
jgi:hypothetical protein